MRVNEILKEANLRCPNSFDPDMQFKLICDFESRLIYEFTGEELDISFPDCGDFELMLPRRYSDIYVLYLAAMYCFWNREYEEYNNHLALFGSLLSQYREERKSGGKERKRFFNLF